jgi:hypothetical protein
MCPGRARTEIRALAGQSRREMPRWDQRWRDPPKRGGVSGNGPGGSDSDTGAQAWPGEDTGAGPGGADATKVPTQAGLGQLWGHGRGPGRRF